MSLQWLSGWWNLIFILPFGLGLLYLGMYTFSGWTFGEAGGDVGLDHDVDAHLDVDGHIDIDHDADLSHDVHVDADTDSDAASHETESNSPQGSTFLSALNWIGFGRMPLSLVLMIGMISWGTIGFAANQLQRGQPLMQAEAIAIAAAAVVSLFITHFVSSILSKLLFNTMNVPRRRHELLGLKGEALYPIDAKFGMVCGRDDRGNLFQVACRVEDGEPPVEKGTAVQLVGYTAKERMFYVVPSLNK